MEINEHEMYSSTGKMAQWDYRPAFMFLVCNVRFASVSECALSACCGHYENLITVSVTDSKNPVCTLHPEAGVCKYMCVQTQQMFWSHNVLIQNELKHNIQPNDTI